VDLSFTPAERAFRDEVRAFIAAELPPEIKRKGELGIEFTRDDFLAWHRILYRKGWIAPAWPRELGGTGWTPTQRYIFDEELGRASGPRIMPFGLSMLGPVLMAFGSEAQKTRYLPRILSGEDWWCQGYSEPGAGSDLAALSTKAVSDGDHYVVDGSKIWTTYAHYADHIFCLARTSVEKKKQDGISFLLFKMDTPGITVRPIVTIDGAHVVNQVFLEGVRVPKANLVGKEGQGWTIAKYLLGHERTSIAGVGWCKQQVRRIKAIARTEQANGGPLIEDVRFATKLAAAEVELMALEYTNLRVLAAESAGRAPGPEASLLKIKGTEVQQALTGLLREAVGYRAHPLMPEVLKTGWNEPPIGPDYAMFLAPLYFGWRKASIYGGSNEIQKNIIAKAVLGL